MEFYNAEMVPKVIKLFDGYSKYIDDKTMDANCSCTLIRANKTIIVDTMTAWDRENLINGAYYTRLSNKILIIFKIPMN